MRFPFQLVITKHTKHQTKYHRKNASEKVLKSYGVLVVVQRAKTIWSPVTMTTVKLFGSI